MAKRKITASSKPKTSIFLCCFGSSLPMESTMKGSDPISKEKKKTSNNWFSWRRIRINKNSAYKTALLEAASISDHVQYSKSRSKSTIHHKLQAPPTDPPPPTHPAPVLPGTPYYTPSQTRHGANNVEDTRQQGRASPAHPKRQGRRVSSSMQNQTTTKKQKAARGSYNPVVGMSVLGVTLVIMIFWGRLCAILCTSAWLYFIPRFRKNDAENDDGDPNTTVKSNDVDLDSEEYKKKVIMEGLLERNHRAIF